MLIEETAEELSAALIAAPTTRAFLRTDGRGGLVVSTGLEVDVATELAERIDLAIASTTMLGRGRFGPPTTLIIEFEGALLLAGVQSWGEHVVVLVEAGANVGLVLSRLRRLLSRDAREREQSQ